MSERNDRPEYGSSRGRGDEYGSNRGADRGEGRGDGRSDSRDAARGSNEGGRDANRDANRGGSQGEPPTGPRSGKSNRGFASMSPERQREIASKGGRAAHEKGTAHEWTADEARQAGRKGGEVVSRDRAHMAAIGREGGGARGGRRTPQSNQAIGESASGERNTAEGRDFETRDASRNSFSMPSSDDLGNSSSGR